MRRLLSLLAFVPIVVVSLVAQQAQNPSPMVEHTRRHERLPAEPAPGGSRTPLATGTLFVPAKVTRAQAPLLVHFHGGALPAEVAGAANGLVVVSVQLGSGSSAYARPFSDPSAFASLLAEAEAKSGKRFTAVTLSGWSAGYGAVREILRVPAQYARVERVILIDDIHTGYVGDAPGKGPGLESVLDPAPLDTFLQFARDAVAGKKRMTITHSEIFPGTFASTTECTDWLLGQLHLPRRPVLAWGPMGLQQLSDVRAGGFHLMGFAGNSAPDHVDQLHALPALVKRSRVSAGAVTAASRRDDQSSGCRQRSSGNRA